MLWDEETTLVPNTYTYHFQFKLDRNHPITLDYTKLPTHTMSITTRLKAEVKFKRKKNKIKTS